MARPTLLLLAVLLTLPWSRAAQAQAPRPTQAQASRTTQAQTNALDGVVRFYGQVGGAFWGNVDYSPTPEGPVSNAVKPSGDLRAGASWIVNRFFSLDLALGYTNWQTRYFEAYGRAHSRAVHGRVGPTLRIPLGRSRSSRAPSLLVGLAAGPAFAFVSEDVPHVKVREENSPRPGLVVDWTHGIEIPIVPQRVGIRVQLDWDFMRLSYQTRLKGPSGAVGVSHFDDLIRRPVLLVGVWVQP